MNKIYNKAFCIGVSINILIFIILNIISLIVSRNERIRVWNSGIRIGSYDGYFWGFPFEMFRGMYLFAPEGLVINTFIITICSFIIGFLCKFIWAKISPRPVKLK